jgi:hypothetical protein
MIAVMLQTDDEPAPSRRYFAVARGDRSRAEWAAVDAAVALGRVATSPIGGLEPVAALAPITARVAQITGLADREVRALGAKWPRRWIGGS